MKYLLCGDRSTPNSDKGKKTRLPTPTPAMMPAPSRGYTPAPTLVTRPPTAALIAPKRADTVRQPKYARGTGRPPKPSPCLRGLPLLLSLVLSYSLPTERGLNVAIRGIQVSTIPEDIIEALRGNGY